VSSKAERKRRKRTIIIAKGGRPRQDGPREPNGRINRRWKAQESERSAVRTATEARQRLFGLPEAVCTQPDAMTVLGRLKLAGRISPDEHDAAIRYSLIRRDYQMAIAAPPDFKEPKPEENSTGMEYEVWVKRAVDRYNQCKTCLSDLCGRIRNPSPWAAIDVIVFKDILIAELVPHLALALRTLNEQVFKRSPSNELQADYGASG
jgi:hypothetical protein